MVSISLLNIAQCTPVAGRRNPADKNCGRRRPRSSRIAKQVNSPPRSGATASWIRVIYKDGFDRRINHRQASQACHIDRARPRGTRSAAVAVPNGKVPPRKQTPPTDAAHDGR